MRTKRNRLAPGFAIAAAAALIALPACSSKHDAGNQASGGGAHASGAASAGVIKIDGSSTVFPITQAVAEEYQADRGGRVTVGVSGTGGGFKKFCRGETSLSGASRPITKTEIDLCAKNGIDWIELPIAYDGIAVVVNPKNDWVDHLTVAELKTMWEPAAQGKVTKWSHVRTGWPDRDLHLFGPGVDSGTYDYFTKAIVGTEHASRGDFTSSEDDNVLVQGVTTDENALGYFGYAYYIENKDRLKVVPIDDGNPDNGAGPIAPSVDTIANSTYQPLSRPIFLYVSKPASQRPEVDQFVTYFLDHAHDLVEEVGYVPLPAAAMDLVKARYKARTTGSLFTGGSKVGVSVQDLLKTP